MSEPGNAEKQPADEKVGIPIEFDIPPDLSTRYSNYVMVQKAELECFVTFFEIVPPPFVGSGEQLIEQIKNAKAVAKAQVRLAVPNELMARLAEVIRTLGLDKCKAIDEERMMSRDEAVELIKNQGK